MHAATFKALPNNVAALRALVIDLQARLQNRDDVLQAREAQLQAGQQELVYLRTWIERLKLELARLRRMQFGRSSEQLSARIEQLELIVEEFEASAAQQAPAAGSPPTPARKPVRKPLPEHLPRETVIHAPDPTCPDCGTTMQRLGEDVSEMLEYVPARFKVIRQVRPKLSCGCCQRIVQLPAPIRPIDRGLPGPGLLAHVAVSKFADSLPLYRQVQIYAREGVELERSTLADWLGGVARLTQPLVDALGRYVLSANKLHADDTPVPVLEPGRGVTKTGRLWTYVRDDRPAGSADAPAVWFQYSPDRKGERPLAHLQDFTGVLQADGYAGFNGIYERGGVVEAACWARAAQVLRHSPRQRLAHRGRGADPDRRALRDRSRLSGPTAGPAQGGAPSAGRAVTRRRPRMAADHANHGVEEIRTGRRDPLCARAMDSFDPLPRRRRH